jgi:ribosomal protein L16 Arg81 hydroxylase
MARPQSRGLAWILGPMEPEIFITQYLHAQPIHIKGEHNRFSGLFNRTRFEQLVAVFRENGEFAEKHGTTCLRGIDRFDDTLADLVRQVRVDLNYSGMVDIRAYFSPDGGGFDTHYDARSATTLQIEGNKRWRFSKQPAIPFPYNGGIPELTDRHQPLPFQLAPGVPDPREKMEDWEQFERPREEEFIEVILEPGDVLSLPAGTWHSASAVGPSLALNLAFGYVRPSRMPFFELLGEALREQLARRPQWRGPAPAAQTRAEDPRLPSPVGAFFAARIAELRAALDRLDPNGPELAHAWRRCICALDDPAPAPSPNGLDSLTRADVLVTPGPNRLKLGFAPDSDAGVQLMLYCTDPPVQVGFPVHTEPFLQRLVKARRFRAERAMAWAGNGERYAWSEVKEILETLVELGCLRRAAR